MRIDQLDLANFRGFEALHLDLHPEFNVIVGINGAGKSSVLDALAVALGGWLVGFPGVAKRNILREEGRLVRREVGGVVGLEWAGAAVVAAEGVWYTHPIQWTRELRSPEGRTTTGGLGAMKALSEEAQRHVSKGTGIELPVIAYYGTGRLWIQKREGEQRASGLASRLQGYDACLEPASDAKLLARWMRWREEIRLQQIARGTPPTAAEDPHLEAVQAAARSCIEGARLVYYDFAHDEIRVDLEDGRTLPFTDLSDGYRNLIAVAADIAWRAVRLNPQFGREAPERVAGVVLIDEVDLHLHPAWQRRVIGDLRRTFPRIQFVVTTHSPQVLSTAKAEWVRVLVPGQPPARIPYAQGRDSNTLLEDVFGVPERPAEDAAEIRVLADLIDRGNLAASRAKLAELEGKLGRDDPDVVRCRTWLDLDLVPPERED